MGLSPIKVLHFPFLSQTVAIIMGGEQPAVEMWNPNTGTVHLLMDAHPAETATLGLISSAMISINGTLPTYNYKLQRVTNFHKLIIAQ